MMPRLSEIFRRLTRAECADAGPARDEELRLATAVLLVEIMRADFSERESEARAIE